MSKWAENIRRTKWVYPANIKKTGHRKGAYMLRAIGALLCVLLLCGQTVPHPSQRCPHERTQLCDRTAATYERGSEAFPVFTKALPFRPSKADANKALKQSLDDLLNDWWTLFFVGLTAVFTGLGVIVAIVQACFFFSQLKIMKSGITDATKAANAAASEAELARKQYIAANRPRLRVRKVSIDAPVEGNMIVVRYEVVNVGGTKAAIIDNEVTVRIVGVPSGAILYGGMTPEIVATRQFHFADEVQQGEALLAEGEILVFSPQWGFDASSWWKGRLFVIGTIRYRDDNGVTRRTAFYRVATEDRHRFEIANLSDSALADHEYED